MRTRVTVPVLAALAALAAALSVAGVAGGQGAQQKFRVLVFSKTEGFRHDSIETGVDAIRQLGRANRFGVDATEDATEFRYQNLRRYEAVIFLSTTGDVLNANQQSAFQRYIRDGGGFTGIHAAADTEYEWPFYGELVGAYFKSHPAIQEATVEVADRLHPSTRHLPERWTRTDEWYDYQANPRGKTHVLATLDEGTYEGADMGADHPIAWCQNYEGARSWYTGGGHTGGSYSEPDFRRHLLGGIRWAAGDVAGDCRATTDAGYQKVTLNDRPGEPMDLAVLPDGRVLHTARTGEVRIHDPETGLNTIAANPELYEHDEEGMQSVAIDPDFASNHWVYLYYSPPLDTPVDDPETPDVNEGDAPFEGTEEDFAPFRGHIQLSRFKLEGNELAMDTEQKILQVPVDRGICCHVGGDIDFDGDGNLLLSTGDDTNPFESDGFTPIDERPNRNPAFDAQRTAANTNDLRGKVLRIRVNAGGGYSIPSGNLFPEGTPQTRPEIYAMGLRNPFRFTVNRDTNEIYIGDYSPDSDVADPARGPAGHGKWMVIREPGNYGWPYCATPDLPYVDYDFATETSGAQFDCANPVNESPHNTGLEQLPAVAEPDVPYSYALSERFPELEEGGIGPMGGPAYEFSASSDSVRKWPRYYDGVPLFYEWTRDYIKEFRLGGNGDVFKINPVLDSFATDNPMDLEFGPDGALYMLEYGDGFFSENPEAQLSRIDYVGGGNRTPVPEIEADRTSAAEPPLTVVFSSAGTHDPDGDALTYAWDFDADGTVDSTEPNPSFTYQENGVYEATLKVTDRTGRSAATSVQIVVGNEQPQVQFVAPVEGDEFSFGDQVAFEIQVTDDQPVNCDEVEVTYILGHDEHGHPLSTASGCSGTIQTSIDPGHGSGDNLRGVFVAEYTDPGAEGVPALTGSDEVVLTPSE
jgi:cytochrome c